MRLRVNLDLLNDTSDGRVFDVYYVDASDAELRSLNDPTDEILAVT